MKSAFWIILLKYGLGLGLLTYVIIHNWSDISKVFQRPIHPGPLLLAALIVVVGLLITFLRWHLLVRAVGLPFDRYNAIRLGLVGYYFNTFLPGSIGGDIIKAYAIAREQSRRTVAVATVLFDRIVGLWALVTFVAIVGGVLWMLDDPILQTTTLRSIARFTSIFVVISAGIWYGIGFLSEERATRFAAWLAGFRKVGNSLSELWAACWMYRKQTRAVFVAIAMSMVGHTGWVLVFHFSVTAFETPNPASDIGTFPEHMMVVPVGMTVQALIPVPGGIGAGEAAYGKLYEIIQKPEANGVIGCLSQRIVFWAIGLIGYLIYTRMRVRTANGEELGRDPPNEPPPTRSDAQTHR